MRYLSLGIIISPVCVSCQVNEKTIHALYKVENNRSYSIISLLACLSLSSPQSKSSKFKKLRKHTKLMKLNFPLLWFVYVYHCSIAFVSHLPINNLDLPIRPTLSICDIHPQVFVSFGLDLSLIWDMTVPKKTKQNQNIIELSFFAFVKWLWKGNRGRRRG